MIERLAGKTLVAALISAASLVAPAAHANIYKELHITRNTTLRDHVFGSVVFDADNITLDCAGKQVHISSYSKINCDDGFSKCGIVADNRSNVTIKNCYVVGGFDRGVSVTNTVDSTVSSVQSLGAGEGFRFQETARIRATDLIAAENEHGVVIVMDDDSEFDAISTQTTTVGVYAWHVHGTTFHDIYSAYTERGFSSEFLFDVSLRFVTIEASWRGFLTQHSQRIWLEAGSFEWLGGEGISLHNTTDSVIYENDSLNNEGPDACQDQWSLGNVWQGNAFGDWCSSVPDDH
jgi:hypothetical protein